MGADEGLCIKGGRGPVIASGERGSAGGLHLRLDPGDGCEAREARLAGRGPVRPQPTSRLTAGLDATVIGVHRLAAVGGGVQAIEAKLGLLQQVALIGPEREQTIGAAVEHDAGDHRVAAIPSMVTSAPVSASRPAGAEMASASSAFSARLFPEHQRLTQPDTRGEPPRPRSSVRREVLPLFATMSGSASRDASAQAAKAVNRSGSSAAITSQSAPRLAMPRS